MDQCIDALMHSMDKRERKLVAILKEASGLFPLSPLAPEYSQIDRLANRRYVLSLRAFVTMRDGKFHSLSFIQ